MPVHHPEDMPRAFSEPFNAGQVDALVALYEPDATLVAQPGRVVTGTEQIRAAYNEFLALKGRISVTPKRVLAGREVALAWSTWALTGTGPDGKPAPWRPRSAPGIRPRVSPARSARRSSRERHPCLRRPTLRRRVAWMRTCTARPVAHGSHASDWMKLRCPASKRATMALPSA
jgi:ketosteroid isomerase-like protein